MEKNKLLSIIPLRLKICYTAVIVLIMTILFQILSMKNYHLDNNYDGESVIENVFIESLRTKNISKLSFTMIMIIIIIILLLISVIDFSLSILLPLEKLYKTITPPKDIKLSSRNELKFMLKDIEDNFNKLNSFIKVIENMNTSSNFKEILNYIFHSFSDFIPYNYIGIALIEENNMLRGSYGISSDPLVGLPDKIIGEKVLLSSTSLDNVIKSGQPRIINNLKEYTANKPLKHYNKIILDAGIRSSITLPLKYNGEAIGIIFFSSKKKNVYTEEHATFLKAVANSIAIAFEKNIFIEEIIFSSILALAKLAESRDEDTGEHLYRMQQYSRKIAEFLSFEEAYSSIIDLDFIENIEKFSPLHDIGKVGVRDNILLKPDKLSKIEFEEMKLHTVYGGEVLRAAEENIAKRHKSLFKFGIEIAENHHEKWDGSGYPKGKKGEEIPLSARIVALADVFDALTSKRPYKEAFTLERTFQLIKEGRGSHFDPNIVDVFFKNKDCILKLYYKLTKNDIEKEISVAEG